MKLAFIVQRYGTEILGGSEYHCRLIAERLSTRHQVDVLTTCARDYVTWKNEYPEGVDRVRGVNVRRFAVSETRDVASFNEFSDWIFTTEHGAEHEEEWLRRQGPWSPGLLDYLAARHESYDALIFFTYLYAPTVLGLRIAPHKSILVPTAHDEPAIHLSLYRDVFALPAAIAYNTEVERHFLKSHFSIRALAEETIGCGVDLPHGDDDGAEAEAPENVRFDELDLADARDDPQPVAPHIAARGAMFRRRHRLHGPFALYGGRIDPGKGCEELIEYFSSYVQGGGESSLVLMGVKLMQLPEERWVRFAGLLSERERLQALEAATVVIVPSPYESLSLLALEAFAVGTPVLANARSDVLVDHCLSSNAGLFYADRDEFVEALSLLMGDQGLRAALGRNGQEYVRRQYRWDVILSKYDKLLSQLREGA